MRIRSPIPLLLFAAALIGAVFLATRRDLSEPHLRLFKDMVYSPAYKSQEPNPVLGGAKALRLPVPGTIPRGANPLHYGSTAAERKRAGKELKNPVPLTLAVLERGEQVYGNFCAHCHGKYGRGRGPTAKAFAGFSFPLATQAAFDLPDGELFHIISYGRNLMPAHAAQLTQNDRWKLIRYLRDLQQAEIARLGPLAVAPEDPRRHRLISAAYGRELFGENCASCHGAKGRHPKRGIPTLHSQSVLGVAGDSFYWDIIKHGRKGTRMPAWEDILTPTQIRSVIAYFRSWSKRGAGAGAMAAARGSADRGKALYRGRCSGCHGMSGKGGIGISLNSPTFQALASDAFLRDTIVYGRGRTAMPSFYSLSAKDVADLIAFLRGWRKPPPEFTKVAGLVPEADPKMGRKLFRARCASCHGRRGKGGIGPRLNGQSFLRTADDRHLYRAIVEGRPGTAMPGWSFLGAEDVADLIRYLRGWQKKPAIELSTQRRSGRPEFGELLFKKNCTKCHGPSGQGDIGVQLSNPVFLDSVTDDYLYVAIAYGRAGTEMKGFLKRRRDPLDEQDINHVISYLRRLQETPSPERRRTYSWASAEDGREIFEKKGDCAKCHGRFGEGGSGPSLSSKGFLHAASDGYLAGTVVMGREGTEMKSFSSGGSVRLTQEEVENVVAYVRGFEKLKAPRVRRRAYARGDIASGRLLFKRYCSGCHGSEGLGGRGNRVDGYAPALNNQQFLHAATDDLLLATIAIGRPGTPMRPFGKGMGGIADLSAKDIRRIVAFIRSFEKNAEK